MWKESYLQKPARIDNLNLKLKPTNERRRRCLARNHRNVIESQPHRERESESELQEVNLKNFTINHRIIIVARRACGALVVVLDAVVLQRNATATATSTKQRQH